MPGKPRWKPEDFVDIEAARGFVFVDEEGLDVVWEKSWQPTDKDRQRRVVQIERTRFNADGEPETRTLLKGHESCHSIRLSPDHEHLLFLSNRENPDSDLDDTKTQVWAIRLDGGEAWPVTDFERGVEHAEWVGDEHVAVVAKESAAWYEKEREDAKEETEIVEDDLHEPPLRLFKVELSGEGKPERLSWNNDRIDALWVSPDGKHLVTRHEKSLRFTYDNRIWPEAQILNLETHEWRRVFTDEKAYVGHVAWKPDSSGFYLVREVPDREPFLSVTIGLVWEYSVDKGQLRQIELEQGDRGVLYNELCATKEGFIAVLENGLNPETVVFEPKLGGWRRRRLDTEHNGNIFEISTSADGTRVAYSYSKSDLPTQWYVAELNGSSLKDAKQVTKLNEGLDKKPKARTETVKWQGALGEEVEGVLYYPHDYEEGKRYPLMLNIHGGPHGQDFDRWSAHWAHANQILCEKGCFVLCPNYHGSSGYGQAFGASIRDGHYYDYPVEDIRKGVDHLIEKGLVDADRLGTSGWSNGAILSTALIVEDQRFKVASAGAGGSEWVADWGVCDFGLSFLNYYMGKSPLEDPELYIREAPLFKFHKVQTPTIFFHGTADGAVPYHHSMVQFHALQEATTTETRFVSFDGEPHGLQNRTGKLRKIREEMEWIGRFLLGEEPPRAAQESLKKGSRLAYWLKAKEEAATADGLYGELLKNRLVPEIVEHKELKVGRFPVTWAQFSVFKADMTPGSHTGNYPATVSYEWAEKYCQWLSKLLGRKVRLPSREEAETLADLGSAANTLDDWAGYPVNPDDEQCLKTLLEGHEARLLKPVDENGVGEDPVLFDVNGNAAEWFNDGGKPKLRGPAADSANDEKVRFAPRTKLTGFRVVEEKPKETG